MPDKTANNNSSLFHLLASLSPFFIKTLAKICELIPPLSYPAVFACVFISSSARFSIRLCLLTALQLSEVFHSSQNRLRLLTALQLKACLPRRRMRRQYWPPGKIRFLTRQRGPRTSALVAFHLLFSWCRERRGGRGSENLDTG
eukprot:g77145.t1